MILFNNLQNTVVLRSFFEVKKALNTVQMPEQIL